MKNRSFTVVKSCIKFPSKQAQECPKWIKIEKVMVSIVKYLAKLKLVKNWLTLMLVWPSCNQLKPVSYWFLSVMVWYLVFPRTQATGPVVVS
jgi:hypothetical protein